MAEEEERQRRLHDEETPSEEAQTRHAIHDRMAVVEEELLHKVKIKCVLHCADPNHWSVPN